MSQKTYGLREKPKKTTEGEEWESSQNRNNRTRKSNLVNENKLNKPNKSYIPAPQTSGKGATGKDNPGWPQKARKAVSVEQDKEVCRSCKKSFTTKELSMHEAMCIKLGPTDSFFKLVRPKETPSTTNGMKVALPSSQPR